MTHRFRNTTFMRYLSNSRFKKKLILRKIKVSGPFVIQRTVHPQSAHNPNENCGNFDQRKVLGYFFKMFFYHNYNFVFTKLKLICLF
nr:hypothetical protein [Chlorella vulgaris]